MLPIGIYYLQTIFNFLTFLNIVWKSSKLVPVILKVLSFYGYYSITS